MLQTHSQRTLLKAIELVSSVPTRSSEKTATQKMYGSLCYDFPIMVMASGLAQTTAYYEAKAQKLEAYRFFLEDMGKMLAVDTELSPGKDWIQFIRETDVRTYMLATERLIQAGVYFKHLASSILGVDSASEVEEGEVV